MFYDIVKDEKICVQVYFGGLMFCKQCGAKVEAEEGAFCQECGTPIDTQKNENTSENLGKHIEYKNDECIKELKSRLVQDVSKTDVSRGLHVSVPPEEIVEVIVEKKVPKSTQVHTQKESVNTKEKDELKTSTKSNTNVKDDLYDQAQKGNILGRRHTNW